MLNSVSCENHIFGSSMDRMWTTTSAVPWPLRPEAKFIGLHAAAVGGAGLLRLSMGVRGSPCMTETIVTQLVTQSVQGGPQAGAFPRH